MQAPPPPTTATAFGQWAEAPDSRYPPPAAPQKILPRLFPDFSNLCTSLDGHVLRRCAGWHHALIRVADGSGADGDGAAGPEEAAAAAGWAGRLWAAEAAEAAELCAEASRAGLIRCLRERWMKRLDETAERPAVSGEALSYTALLLSLVSLPFTVLLLRC